MSVRTRLDRLERLVAEDQAAEEASTAWLQRAVEERTRRQLAEIRRRRAHWQRMKLDLEKELASPKPERAEGARYFLGEAKRCLDIESGLEAELVQMRDGFGMPQIVEQPDDQDATGRIGQSDGPRVEIGQPDAGAATVASVAGCSAGAEIGRGDIGDGGGTGDSPPPGGPAAT